MNAILHGDRDRHLRFHSQEHPIALQLGGDDPTRLAECAKIAVDEYGYDEVNINVGCPSDRVQSGNFGACLMKTPEIVAECVAAMRAVVEVPITVKHRIGVDDIDRYEDMANFVEVVSRADSDRFTVHARKAWLQGLSPKQNRNVPPLRYEEVYRLKQEFSHLPIEINGGIKTLDQTCEHLQHVDAVMIGRGAVDTPWIFAEADTRVFGAAKNPVQTREELIFSLEPYIEDHVRSGERLHRVTRHLLTLFAGLPGTRAWKRTLTEEGAREGAGFEVLRRGLEAVRRAQESSQRRHGQASPAAK